MDSFLRTSWKDHLAEWNHIRINDQTHPSSSPFLGEQTHTHCDRSQSPLSGVLKYRVVNDEHGRDREDGHGYDLIGYVCG